MIFLRKTDETIWNPPPLLSTNPLFLSNFFMIPTLSKFQKQKLILGGVKETMMTLIENSSVVTNDTQESQKYPHH